MERFNRDKKFFRFRSLINVFKYSQVEERTRLNWLTNSLQHIDFNFDIFIQEAFLVGVWSKGGIQMKDLESMPFDRYELAVKEALRIQEINTNENG